MALPVLLKEAERIELNARLESVMPFFSRHALFLIQFCCHLGLSDDLYPPLRTNADYDH